MLPPLIVAFKRYFKEPCYSTDKSHGNPNCCRWSSAGRTLGERHALMGGSWLLGVAASRPKTEMPCRVSESECKALHYPEQVRRVRPSAWMKSTMPRIGTGPYLPGLFQGFFRGCGSCCRWQELEGSYVGEVCFPRTRFRYAWETLNPKSPNKEQTLDPSFRWRGA